MLWLPTGDRRPRPPQVALLLPEPLGVDDAVTAFGWLGLLDVAAVSARARDEYLRFRPTGCEDLSAEDSSLWEQLDDTFLTTAGDARLEAAVAARLPDIGQPPAPGSRQTSPDRSVGTRDVS